MKATRFWGPSLYDREAPGFAVSYSPEDIQKAIKIARSEHPFDLSIKDSQTCIDALKGKGAVFITGFCYGGTVTWAAACKCDGLAAASGYYGGQIAQMNDWQPKCPTILHFGENDHGIPMSDVEKIRSRASRREGLCLRRLRPRLQLRPPRRLQRRSPQTRHEADAGAVPGEWGVSISLIRHGRA